MFLSRERAEVNRDFTDNGTSCATCREMRREKQDELLSHETLLVHSCHHLNFGNFLSDHQLLHSWDFPRCSVSSRPSHGLRTHSHRQTGHVWESARTRRCARLVFSSTVKIRFSINSEVIVECVMRATENGKKKR